MVKFCVFDTETTDKLPFLPGKDWNERTKNDARLLDINHLYSESSLWKNPDIIGKWPSIIQFSYIIYDLEDPKNAKIFKKYIDIPKHIVISEGSIEIHHITREKIENESAEKKAPIDEVLMEFMNDIMNPEITLVVAHNAQFDRKMVIAELLRLAGDGVDEDMNKAFEYLMDDSKFECTMNATASICNIQMPINYKDKKTGEDKVFYKIKPPRLSESYKYYFGYSPSGDELHDALIDVIVCLRIFVKYKYKQDVCGKNEIITEYIQKISPEGYVCPLDITDKIETIFDLDQVSEDVATIIIPEKKKRGGNHSRTSKSKKGPQLRRSKRIRALRKK
jgi:DNA polymerase III epsilon subunit-like protein